MCVCGGGGGGGGGGVVLCVCASALSCNGESELTESVHGVTKYISHMSDQSQGCGVGDGGMRTVDCREEQKWLPFPVHEV